MRRATLSILLAIAVAVAFMPQDFEAAYAAEAGKSVRAAEEGQTVDSGDGTDGSQSDDSQPGGGQTGGEGTGEGTGTDEPGGSGEEPEPGTDPEPGEEPEPDTIFNPDGKVKGLKRAGYTYNTITLSWNAYEKADGYEVYRAKEKEGSFYRIKTVTGTSYKRTNLIMNKVCYYKVRAYVIKDGKRQRSGFSGVLATKPTLPAPEVTTSGSKLKVTVSWPKVYGATEYRIYRATSKTGEYKRQAKLTVCKYSQEVKQNKKYYYKVRAYRKDKSGYTCQPVEAMTTLTAPVTVTVKSRTGGGINISWTKVTGAAGYRIYRSRTKTDVGVLVNSTVCTETAYTDKSTKLVNGVTYYYRVRAVSKVNGKYRNGFLSVGDKRKAALEQAKAWIGVKEGSAVQKEIVSIYNSRTEYDKIDYWIPWCAAFVSAVGIKTYNTDVIPIDCYCPRMLANFEGTKKSYRYTPQGADIIFFDWNGNRSPDHVGMVYYVKDGKIHTIEGNTTIEDKYKTDGVHVRTFGSAWARSYVQNYCVPAYAVMGKIKYTGKTMATAADDAKAATAEAGQAGETGQAGEMSRAGETGQVGETALGSAVNEAEAEVTAAEAEEAAAVAEEAAKAAASAAEPGKAASEKAELEALVEYIQQENPAEAAEAEESTYDAVLLMEACEEMGIDACVITEFDENGNVTSHNEVMIDGEICEVDASEN